MKQNIGGADTHVSSDSSADRDIPTVYPDLCPTSSICVPFLLSAQAPSCKQGLSVDWVPTPAASQAAEPV